MGSMARSRAIVGSAVARMVESVFSMKSAVATTSGTTGIFMASGLADMGWRAVPQHLPPLRPAPSDLGCDRIRGAEGRVAPTLEPLERVRQRPRGAVPAQGRVEARELGRAALRLEHEDGLAGGARLTRHVD